MRCVTIVAAAATLGFVAGSPARAVDPGDMPWDEIDRVLKQSQSQEDAGSEPKAAVPKPGEAAKSAAPLSIELNVKVPAPVGTTGNSTSPVAAPSAAHAAPAQPAIKGETPAISMMGPEASPPTRGLTNQPPATPANPDTRETNPVDPPTANIVPAGATPPAKPSAVPAAIAPIAADPAASPPAASSPQASATIVASGLYLPIVRYISARATDALAKYGEGSRKALLKLYEARMGEALWVTKDGYSDAGKTMIATLQDAASWGLNADDYAVPDLAHAAGAVDDDLLTAAEARLSLAAMQYAIDARGGRIPNPESLLSTYLDRKPATLDCEKLLKGLLEASDRAAYLQSFQPKQPQFLKLRAKLAQLRSEGPAATPAPIPEGPLLKPGKSHAQVALVRARLKIAAPAAGSSGSSSPDFYDDALAAAVVAFKEKNGLSPANANITNALRKALNVHNEIGEATLIANMEEWRWMPEDLGALHISVNIPEFLVRLVKDDKVIFEERIVSGKPETQTPIFSNMMRTVVFQPRWNVPESIKIKEMLPGLRAGGNPVAKEGLVMMKNGRKISPLSVDWSRADIRNFELYQPPGPRNALGIVKFLFPNKHAVYLHDTPVKSLFNARVRTFSHGCMRVRNPLSFAQAILKQDKGMEEDEVNRLATSGPEENEMKLDHPIPVHVTYFTALVSDDGNVETFADVYGHEKRITLALADRWNEIEKNGEQTVSPDDAPLTTVDGWADQRDEIQRWQRAGSDSGDHWDPDAPPADREPVRRKRNFFKDTLRQVFGGV